MKNIAVFASGRGSNFAAIAQAIKRGKLFAHLALLVCDNPGAPVIRKAQAAGVKVLLVLREDFPTKEAFEDAIIRSLKKADVDVIALAGFMRMLGPRIISRYRNKIINIHPALLPAFKGSSGIADAFRYGVKVTGVTVHFVDEQMDHGPIIMQAPVAVKERDTSATLEKKIHSLEHGLYPAALQLIVHGKVRLVGRKVRVVSP
jgi:phosphoribosylglycinamide formyltransferase-1